MDICGKIQRQNFVTGKQTTNFSQASSTALLLFTDVSTTDHKVFIKTTRRVIQVVLNDFQFKIPITLSDMYLEETAFFLLAALADGAGGHAVCLLSCLWKTKDIQVTHGQTREVFMQSQSQRSL